MIDGEVYAEGLQGLVLDYERVWLRGGVISRKSDFPIIYLVVKSGKWFPAWWKIFPKSNATFFSLFLTFLFPSSHLSSPFHFILSFLSNLTCKEPSTEKLIQNYIFPRKVFFYGKSFSIENAVYPTK